MRIRAGHPVELEALVVGSGSMAEAHVRGFRSFLPGEHIGVCGRNRAAVDRLAHSAGIRSVDLSGDCRVIPRVVVLAVPPQAFLPYLRSFADRAPVFLIEKPIADCPEDLMDLTSFARGRKPKIFVGHVLRANQPHQHLRNMLHQNELGRVTGWSDTRTCWRPHREKNWWPSLRTGLLGFQGTHGLDLLTWMLRRPLRQARYECQHLSPVTGWCDAFRLQLLSGETAVELCHSWAQQGPARNELVVRGSRGTATLVDFRTLYLDGRIVLDAGTDWFIDAVRRQCERAYAVSNGDSSDALCTLQQAEPLADLIFSLIPSECHA